MDRPERFGHDVLDNAMAESLSFTLQLELLNRRAWDTRRQLAQAILDYIEVFSNPQRKHSSIKDLSPITYEQRHMPIEAVA
jgi:putative transposase